MAISGQTAKRRKIKDSSSSVVRIKPKRAFRTYKQALNYLFDRTDYERHLRLRYNVTTFDLNRMRKLLAALGDPHKKIETAHIGGTKGKGSTATMLAKMLEANGYKVGLYTSPHVVSLHERISVNSQMVSQIDMLRLINRAYAAIENIAKKSEAPTFFEIMTVLAFMHFVNKNVDIAVIETGLGGRLDSTNVIKPKVVGITNISIDHSDQLGSTIDRIAAEKAGIFKRGVPAISVKQQPEALKVLKKQANAVKAPLSVTGLDIDFSYRFESSREHGPHNTICVTTPTSKFEHLRVPFPGEHQAINCGLALAMLDKLKLSGYKIDNEKAISGLHQVTLAGRMEIIHDDPRIIIDAAHNAASIRALMHAIGQHVPYDSMVVIFGCNADKDVKGMLRQLQYGADKVIFTRSNSPRAMYPPDLADIYAEICDKMCQSSMTLREALRVASSAVGKEDLICITGSFYLVGEAKVMFQGD
jgi:dihydrofolate synthase/folylpolyglutamate synthase